jgi:transposase
MVPPWPERNLFERFFNKIKHFRSIAALAALMRGDAGAPPAWNGVPRPPPFLCLHDLFPTKEFADARALIASRGVKLQNAAIGDHALVDFDVRAARSAGGVGIAGTFAASNLCRHVLRECA